MQLSGSAEAPSAAPVPQPVQGVTLGIGVELFGIAVAIVGVAVGIEPYENGVPIAIFGAVIAFIGLLLHEVRI